MKLDERKLGDATPDIRRLKIGSVMTNYHLQGEVSIRKSEIIEM